MSFPSRSLSYSRFLNKEQLSRILVTPLMLTLLGGTMLVGVSGCSGDKKIEVEQDYPLPPEDVRRFRNGRLTGNGLTLFGGDKKRQQQQAYAGPSLGVNSYLWRATLDTLSFMPLASADPFGGVIITDWYEDPATPNERFKLNVVIQDSELKASAVRVAVFKQQKGEGGQWQDMSVPESLSQDLENKILTRARELKIQNLG